MEKKERYKQADDVDYDLFIDTENHTEFYYVWELIELLNGQDRQIKELEKLNRQEFVKYKEIIKQAQKQLVISELENVKTLINNIPIIQDSYDEYNFQESTRRDCVEVISQRIKELK